MELPAADKHGGTNKLFISIFLLLLRRTCVNSVTRCVVGASSTTVTSVRVLQYQFSAVARHRAGVKLRNRLDGDLFLVCSHQDSALNHAC